MGILLHALGHAIHIGMVGFYVVSTWPHVFNQNTMEDRREKQYLDRDKLIENVRAYVLAARHASIEATPRLDLCSSIACGPALADCRARKHMDVVETRC